MKVNGKLPPIAANDVDDILIPAPIERTRCLVDNIKSKFRLGTIVYGLTSFDFIGLCIIQDPNIL